MSRRSKPKNASSKEIRMVDSLDIVDLSAEGQGVGRTEAGRVLFVPETVPGDTVSVKVIREKKRHGFGQVKELLVPSKDRIEPPCRYFGSCGGCSWQHISDEGQIHWKGKILQQVLQRVGQIELAETPKVYTSVQRYGTRSRLRLQVGPKQTLGFFQRGTKSVVPIRDCPVATPLVNEAWSRLREQLPSLSLPLAEVRLLGSATEGAVASFHMKRNPRVPTQKARKILEKWWRPKQWELQPIRGIELMRGENVLLEVGHTILEEGEPFTTYRPSGFAQAGWEGNRLLVDEVVAAWKRNPTRNVLELYAGCGNLSLALAKAGAYVWGLDSNAQALQDGNSAARAQKLQQRVQFETFDDHLNSLPVFCETAQVSFGMIVLDPPRRGLASRIRDEIIGLQLPRITYVSCDPGTLARDLRSFMDAGYDLEHLSAVDLMPQTAHIESVACLVHQDVVTS